MAEQCQAEGSPNAPQSRWGEAVPCSAEERGLAPWEDGKMRKIGGLRPMGETMKRRECLETNAEGVLYSCKLPPG